MKNIFAKFQKGAKFQSSKQLLMILVSMQILVLGITIYVLRSREGGVGSNASSFVPIWIAVMIPILASSKRFDSKKNKQAFWMLLVGLALLVLLGTVIFLLKVLN